MVVPSLQGKIKEQAEVCRDGLGSAYLCVLDIRAATADRHRSRCLEFVLLCSRANMIASLSRSPGRQSAVAAALLVA